MWLWWAETWVRGLLMRVTTNGLYLWLGFSHSMEAWRHFNFWKDKAFRVNVYLLIHLPHLPPPSFSMVLHVIFSPVLFIHLLLTHSFSNKTYFNSNKWHLILVLKLISQHLCLWPPYLFNIIIENAYAILVDQSLCLLSILGSVFFAGSSPVLHRDRA